MSGVRSQEDRMDSEECVQVAVREVVHVRERVPADGSGGDAQLAVGHEMDRCVLREEVLAGDRGANHSRCDGVAPWIRRPRRSRRERLHDAWRQARLRLREADQADVGAWSVRGHGARLVEEASVADGEFSEEVHFPESRWSSDLEPPPPARACDREVEGDAGIDGAAAGGKSVAIHPAGAGVASLRATLGSPERAAMRSHGSDSNLRVPLGCSAVDAPLGGGLTRDALHAVFGMCTQADERIDPGAGSRERHGRSCASGGWIVPFGALRFLAACALRASGGGACRPVAWIGSRVHPSIAPCGDAASGHLPWTWNGDPHLTTSIGMSGPGHLPHAADPHAAVQAGVEVVPLDGFADDALLARHSLLLHEPDGRGGDRSESVGRGAPRAGARGETSAAAWRAWCTEEAIRAGALAAVVVDATGIDMRAWRRIHLALRSSDDPPLVVMAQPPDQWPASGGARFASTRWEVAPASPEEADEVELHPQEDARARCMPQAGPTWWLALRSIKPAAHADRWGVAGGCAGGSMAPSWRSRLEAGSLRVLLRSSRVREPWSWTRAWSELSERAGNGPMRDGHGVHAGHAGQMSVGFVIGRDAPWEQVA